MHLNQRQQAPSLIRTRHNSTPVASDTSKATISSRELAEIKDRAAIRAYQLNVPAVLAHDHDFVKIQDDQISAEVVDPLGSSESLTAEDLDYNRRDVLATSELAVKLLEEYDRHPIALQWKDAGWASGKARKIADGSLDRKKQSAFYVDITKTAEIGLHPGLITRDEASEAIERAERLADGPAVFSDEYRKLKEILPAIFDNLKDREGFGA